MEMETARLKGMVHREREKSRALETELLNMSGSVGDFGGLTPIKKRGGDNDIEDIHLQELLEHSLALDERARKLTRSAQKKRSKSRASSYTRSSGRTRRQSVDVGLGGVHMHVSRRGSVKMRVEGNDEL